MKIRNVPYSTRLALGTVIQGKNCFYLAVPAVERIVYSTCSINQIENEDVIKSVLPIAESNGFQLAKPFPEWQCRGLPVFEGCKYYSYASSPIPGLSSLNTY